MRKDDIVLAIAEAFELSQPQAQGAVQMTLDSIVDALVAEGRIELRNFGVFEVRRRAARKARNPKTGDRVRVPPRLIVHFKPGKAMQHQVKKCKQPLTPRRK